MSRSMPATVPLCPRIGRGVALDKLDEDLARGRRVEEGDPVAPGSGAGRFVHGVVTAFDELRQRLLHVGNPERHVVEAGAVPGQEAADRSVGIEGLEKLHPSDERDVDALVGKGFHFGTGLARHEFE